MRTPISLFFILLSVLCTSGMEGKDIGELSFSKDSIQYSNTHTVYFRFDRSPVDSTYAQNGRALQNLNDFLQQHPLIDSIIIIGSSSVEGVLEHNTLKAKQRALSFRNYLTKKHPSLNDYKIIIHPLGENWEVLTQLIKNDRAAPDRDSILQILYSNINSGTKKWRLEHTYNGVPYTYLSRKYFKELRYASCTIRYKMEKPATASPAAAPGQSRESETAKQSIDTCRMIAAEEAASPEPAPACTIKKQPSRIAVKTNLLYDIATIINIEAEVSIGKRWSINAEYQFPWWNSKNNNFTVQIQAGGLEGRYWLGSRTNRRVLTGHFLGAYGQGGTFDLQVFTKNGIRGHYFYAAGLSYGYAHTIGKHLSLEYSLGVGYLECRYDKYKVVENGTVLASKEGWKYIYTQFPMLTKAKISLVWLLDFNRKKGGEQ